ncbi:autotransporter domain-containing protein [Lysobacter koreensis]|uniref:Autotransporter domain-containing protein n=1 Tax=Lysobacter koreensis TaxID=266122 RepID=A0ABW2YLI7_9GAMM
MAAALALAAAPALAQTYSQTVFFGDSLTDAGHFRPTLVQIAGPQAAVLGKFTTNPGLVWSEYLADFYDTAALSANQGGTNYAVGGARVGTNSSATLAPGVTVPVPSLATQVNSYLASTGGRADPNALYTVWGGANDLFAVAGGAPAQATIGAAVTAQVGIVGTLQGAGAQYVLVPTVPDLGLTPSFRAQGAVASATATQLATTYNTALFGGLASAGLRVIPLDTFHLLQEIVASPAAYGFGNVTGTACQPQITAQSLTCNPATYVTPNAPDTYAFADGVHPSSKAHAVIADYAVSILEAPRQIAVLPNSAAMAGRARAERVSAHSGKPAADGTRLWSDVRADFQRYGHGDHYDGEKGPALTVGIDWSRGNFVFGAFGGYGRQQLDWGRRGGSFDQDEGTVGGFAGWYGGNAWVNGQLSYSQLSFDIDRTVQLGSTTRTHSGSPDGNNLSVGVNGGWEFGDGAFRHGPVLGVLAQKIDIDGYAESEPQLSTSLAYPDQTFDSLIGSAGWQLSYAIHEHLRPYARLTVDREFEDSAEEAFAQLQSMPNSARYAVPGLEFDHSYGTVLFGARTQLFGLDANLGTSVTVGQKDGNHATVFATVSTGF